MLPRGPSTSARGASPPLFLAAAAGAATMLLLQLLLLSGPVGAAVRAATVPTVRPPSTPLAVRSPYLSTWMPADSIVGTWPQFWTNGQTKGWAGIARVDGAAYAILGNPIQDSVVGLTANAVQKSLTLTPTTSTYVLAAGPVQVTLVFFSPVEPSDPKLQSIPMSYLQISAVSTDGASHSVQIECDISAEWAHGDSSQVATWAVDSSVTVTGGTLQSFTVQAQTQTQFSETGDYPNWGTVVWSTLNANSLTWQSGDDATTIRANFASNGQLANTNNANYRAINSGWPIFAFANDFGSVGTTPTATLTYVIGHVRNQAITYQGTAQNAYWTNYWSDWQGMLQYFYNDLPNAVTRNAALDSQITTAATNANGGNYAIILALATRQAFAGTEFVGSSSDPWLMLKEISSDGNVQTVDVVYPASPILYYLNPDYLRYIMNPLVDYMSSGLWPQSYSCHDIGSSYPNADGHNDGGGEYMPVEESANMLLMIAMYAQSNPSAAATWITSHYSLFRQWADYLVEYGLYPENQLTTDDFAGWIANSTNLALKATLGVGAMGRISNLVGRTGDAIHYTSTAQSFIQTVVSVATDPSGAYLDLAYGDSGVWSSKYNVFMDKLLGLNLVPSSVVALEDAKYRAVSNAYGVPLDARHTYTKGDWELWLAASASDSTLRQNIVNAVASYLNATPQRVPFSDWYDTIAATQNGFQARPVVGGTYSILAVNKGTATLAAPGSGSAIDTSKTYKITVGGRSGCNNILSVASCGSNLVDLYSTDDGSGRQHFTFTAVSGKTNVYNVNVAGGRSGCNTYLSSASCGSNLVDLYGVDDGSGRQQWVLTPSPAGDGSYNVQVVAGRSGCYDFLSSGSCSASTANLVDLYGFDDASGRQEWTLTAV
ncbi:hypothetical protein HK405_005641, partial [Cladochytrium tenue]